MGKCGAYLNILFFNQMPLGGLPPPDRSIEEFLRLANANAIELAGSCLSISRNTVSLLADLLDSLGIAPRQYPGHSRHSAVLPRPTPNSHPPLTQR
jgi:hypothetical protein